jgi:hypothetical protein
MSSSNKSESSPSDGTALGCWKFLPHEFPTEEETKFRSYFHNYLSPLKFRFLSCLLALLWCSQTINNVVVIHDNTTHPTHVHPTPPDNYRGVYVAISIGWILHVPVLAFVPTECATLHFILRVSVYLCAIVYAVVVQGIMGLDGEFVHDLWMLVALVVCLSFTFKQMIPLFIVTTVCNIIVSVLQPSPYLFLNVYMYLFCIYQCWVRENRFRNLWSVLQMKKKIQFGVLKSQRHAIHDVRNVLQEVLGIVEMGSISASGAPSTIEVLENIELTKVVHETGENVEQTEKKQAAPEEVKVKVVTATAADQIQSINPAANNTAADQIPTESDVVLRVRDAVSRMTARLETSLRDGRNTGMDERHRLVPVIHPCNLGKIIFEEYILDPLVTVKLSPDFPNLCETDSEWIKTVVLNLVSNGKKHGPAGCPVEVNLSWTTCQETSAIHIAVTDQGVGVSPARSREIWSGTDTGGRIGISAIKSYVHGLGGTCGNDGPVFWVEVPGGMTYSAFTMSPWTLKFASKKAEQQFIIFGHQPSTTTTTVLIGYVSFEIGIYSKLGK